jgi:hypothetical protein
MRQKGRWSMGVLECWSHEELFNSFVQPLRSGQAAGPNDLNDLNFLNDLNCFKSLSS